MAKSKLDPLAEGSKKAKEFQEIMSGATATLEEFIAANTKMSQELQSVTQQSSAFFQLAAEGASKAASEMKNVSDSSATTSQNIDSLTGAIVKQGKAFEKANKEAGFKKGGDGKNNVFEQLGKSSKVAKAGVIALGGAFNLLGKAIKGVASIIGGIFDVLSTAVGAIKSIIGSVIDLASGAFETMVRASDQVKDRMFEAAQAIEKVKETFGNLEKGSGKEISGFVKKVMGMYSPGAVRQIFGSITEAADYALGLASSSAEMASLLSDQLDNNATKIAMFAKGLGQTTEDFKAVMDMAYTTGESIDSIQESMLKFSQGIGNRLNLNVKVLSKNLLLAAKDVKHFGKATVQSMAESAAYATRMGVSLDKIVGVLDKFDTFEEAANNVSKLSQAFGVNLDTMKLVEADTTEERIEMLKDSFNAAGKSLDSLSRRELSYAASLIGADEATVKNMLSNRNQANSLDDIKNASEGAAKQTRSTADIMDEAMKGVAMTLKKIERQSTGFFDVFLDGIAEGIFLSGPFQKVLANLAMALDAVFMAGKQLGMIIVSTFPGLKQMLDALAKFFDPKKIGELFGGFTTTFEKFFKNLKNGTGDVKDLFKDLFNNIKSYFIKQGPAGQEFLNGVSEFWDAVKQIIATAILAAGDLIADMFNGIADFISKPPGTSGAGLGKIGTKIAKSIEESPITKAFEKAIEKIKPAFRKLKDALMPIIDDMMAYLKDKVEQFFKEHWGKILLVFAGPQLLNVFTSTIAAAMQQRAITAAMTKAMASNVKEGVASGAQGGLNTAAKSPAATNFAGAITGGIVAGLVVATDIVTDGLKRMISDAEKSALNLKARSAQDALTKALASGDAAKIKEAMEAVNKQNEEFGEEINKISSSMDGIWGNPKKDEYQAYLTRNNELLAKANKLLKEQGGIEGKNIADKMSREGREKIESDFQEKLTKAGFSSVEEYQKEKDSSTLLGSLGRMALAGASPGSATMGFLADVTGIKELDVGGNLLGYASSKLGLDKIGLDLTPDRIKKEALAKEYENYQRQKGALAGVVEGEGPIAEDPVKFSDPLDEADYQRSIATSAQSQALKSSQEQGAALMQETIDSMGFESVSIDDIPDRIKKIEEIGATISGGKEKFIENMGKIKADLAEYSKISLFDETNKKEDFQKMLGDFLALETFTTMMDKVFVSMESFGKKASGIGDESGGIIGDMLFGIRSLKFGLIDIAAYFNGGTTTGGTVIEKSLSEYLGGIGIDKIHDAGKKLSKINKKIGKFADGITDLMGHADKVKNINLEGLLQLASLMGSVDVAGDVVFGLSLKDLFGSPEDLTTTAEAIKKWTSQSESMFYSLGKSLENMDKSLAIVDELKKKIASVTELRQQLDSAMQSINEEKTISVQTGAPDSKGSIAAKPKPEKIQTSMGVNMTLKFDIIMDAKSLETAVVTRSDSIVLNALKLLADGTNKVVQESPGHNVFVTKKQ